MTGKILRKLCVWTVVVSVMSGSITACDRVGSASEFLEKKETTEETEEETMKAVNYLDDLLHMNLTGLVIPDAADYISKDNAFLRFRIEDGKLEDVRKLLDETCGELEIEKDQLPGYRNHEIAEKLKSEELTGAWSFFTSGSGGKKTRSMEIYIAKDDEGVSYFYFFG